MRRDEGSREDVARRIADDNLYMTIGMADEQGVAWVSPVYYAPSGYAELFWVSHPEARHSRNIEVRPQVSIAILDSRVPRGVGFSSGSLSHGGAAWTPEDVAPAAGIRLYRARASKHDVLGTRDERTPVDR